MNIAVFCSANDLAEKYTKPAIELCQLCAKAGHNLIWGGSDTGLMKLVADTFKAGGGKIIGVSIPTFSHVEKVGADEMIRAGDLCERKTTMLERSDAIVILVGGLGTLDELMETLELKKHQDHHKPVIVLNTNGFYEHLWAQLQLMKTEGMIIKDLNEFVQFASTPEEAFKYILKNP